MYFLFHLWWHTVMLMQCKISSVSGTHNTGLIHANNSPDTSFGHLFVFWDHLLLHSNYLSIVPKSLWKCITWRSRHYLGLILFLCDLLQLRYSAAMYAEFIICTWKFTIYFDKSWWKEKQTVMTTHTTLREKVCWQNTRSLYQIMHFSSFQINHNKQ